jgi:RecB family exonuclease/inactivated superfamily I helicase
MPIRRRFFDWKRPALAAAADYLWDAYSRDRSWDLDRVIVALPGSRARRRLLELLVGRAEERGAVLVPPRIVTVGKLPELLYEVKKPLADDIAQELAWVRAIQQSPASEMERLVKQLPLADDLAGWLALARMLARVHKELAADRLDFSEVERRGAALADFREADRWQSLAAVQRRYLEILDALELWDKQTARLFAIKHGECRTDRDIVLVGTVDMDLSQRAMLDQVAGDSASGSVTALVFGPDEQMAEFDEHGCLASRVWCEMLLAVDRAQIAVVDGPAQQADAVVCALAEWNDMLAADEVTVGAADESVVPYLEQRLAEAGLAARFGAGTPLARCGAVQLLGLVADFVERGGYADLAALARHPDVSVWLAGRDVPPEYLSSLDRFFGEQLPAEIDADGPAVSRHGRGALAVNQRLAALVAPLAGKPRPLNAWAEAILKVLTDVYGDRELDRSVEADRAVLEVCRHVSECVETFRALDAGVAQSARVEKNWDRHPPGTAAKKTTAEQGASPIFHSLAPVASGAAALRLVVERIAAERLPPPALTGAVEVLGWLELPLDDAAGLIVTGLNEGMVPSVGSADLFLPDRLRGALGLEDNDRRYARDNYALNLLAASRRLKLVAGRRGLEGEPLVPSRLLFACGEREMAERVRQYFDPDAAGQMVRLDLPGRPRAGQAVTDFAVPRPRALAEPVTSLRVTELRDYLVCPYRYYLRHRLKLETLADEAEELAANDFGSLLHTVLKRFADDDVLADSRDPAALAAGLSRLLDAVLAEQFGTKVLAAVRLQAEQARGRLTAFARWQAAWRAGGYRIRQSECAVTEEHRIFLPGDSINGGSVNEEGGNGNAADDDAAPVYLRGRIDRIDVHESTGETIVFDYKTGDTAKTPDKVHLNRENDWIDLQLPLYRHLVRAIGIDGPVRLGYIVLPKDAGEVAHHLAEWTDATLADADAAARAVMRDIRAEKFWPQKNTPDASRLFPEFAAICQDDLLVVGPAIGDDAEEETP